MLIGSQKQKSSLVTYQGSSNGNVEKASLSDGLGILRKSFNHRLLNKRVHGVDDNMKETRTDLFH